MNKSKRQDGWWYPWIFVGAFGVIIAVNSIMAYIAANSWTGLETKHAFKDGQAFNAVLAQKTAQMKLGWTASVDFASEPTPTNAHAGRIHVKFLQADGTDVRGLRLEALAVRPTHEGYDQNLIFTAQGAGVYSAPADLTLPGQWDLRITASHDHQVFKLRQRIQVP